MCKLPAGIAAALMKSAQEHSPGAALTTAVRVVIDSRCLAFPPRVAASRKARALPSRPRDSLPGSLPASIEDFRRPQRPCPVALRHSLTWLHVVRADHGEGRAIRPGLDHSYTPPPIPPCSTSPAARSRAPSRLSALKGPEL